MRLFTDSFRRSSLVFVLLPGSCGAWVQSANTVTGTVLDEQGQPLPGVNIALKGTLTTAKGTFTFSANRPLTAKDVLVFSFVGFQNTEITYAGQTALTVQLKPSDQTVNEVVITASTSGAKKKRSVMRPVP